VQQSVLAYASDMSLLDTALFRMAAREFSDPDGEPRPRHVVPSSFKWTTGCSTPDSRASSGARASTAVRLYRKGKLVGLCLQEGLMRRARTSEALSAAERPNCALGNLRRKQWPLDCCGKIRIVMLPSLATDVLSGYSHTLLRFAPY